MTELPVCKHKGRDKRTYRSKAHANRARIGAGNHANLPAMRVYKCPKCGYYHLSSVKP